MTPITDWTAFWRRVDHLGLPRSRPDMELLIGVMGADPQNALQRLEGYARTHLRQRMLA